jgi:predicted RNase H-like HicB family nuclease
MANEFTAVYEKDGDWYIGYCPEVPGANGQGKTLDECRESLIEAIRLVLQDRRERGPARPTDRWFCQRGESAQYC